MEHARAGGAVAYVASHQRWRDYHADLRLSVVLGLVPEDSSPTMSDLASALRRPARPLFIGRKPCLPTSAIFRGWIDNQPLVEAIRSVAPDGLECEALWPSSAGAESSDKTFFITDERNWISGLHGGAREVCRGRLTGTAVGQ